MTAFTIHSDREHTAVMSGTLYDSCYVHYDGVNASAKSREIPRKLCKMFRGSQGAKLSDALLSLQAVVHVYIDHREEKQAEA